MSWSPARRRSGRLTGTAPLAFTAAGTLGGAFALAGNTTVAFTGAGALRGGTELAGIATVAFDGLGDLQALPEGTIFGTTTLTFSPVGALGVLPIPGESPPEFTTYLPFEDRLVVLEPEGYTQIPFERRSTLLPWVRTTSVVDPDAITVVPVQAGETATCSSF